MERFLVEQPTWERAAVVLALRDGRAAVARRLGARARALADELTGLSENERRLRLEAERDLLRAATPAALALAHPSWRSTPAGAHARRDELGWIPPAPVELPAAPRLLRAVSVVGRRRLAAALAAAPGATLRALAARLGDDGRAFLAEASRPAPRAETRGALEEQEGVHEGGGDLLLRAGLRRLGRGLPGDARARLALALPRELGARLLAERPRRVDAQTVAELDAALRG